MKNDSVIHPRTPHLAAEEATVNVEFSETCPPVYSDYISGSVPRIISPLTYTPILVHSVGSGSLRPVYTIIYLVKNTIIHLYDDVNKQTYNRADCFPEKFERPTSSQSLLNHQSVDN